MRVNYGYLIHFFYKMKQMAVIFSDLDIECKYYIEISFLYVGFWISIGLKENFLCRILHLNPFSFSINC